MSTIWIVSLVLAWVVIGLLCAAVVTLLRHVGELRAGAALAPPPEPLAAGPHVYDEVVPIDLPLVGPGLGGRVRIGGEQELPALLAFHAPGCPSCDGIEDALEALAAQRPDVRFVSVVGLERRAAREHARALDRRHALTIAAQDVPRELVPAALPALVAIAREGVVAAVGSPESPQHLREAADVAAGAVLIAGPDSIRATDWGHAVPAWDAPALDVLRGGPDEPGAPAA